MRIEKSDILGPCLFITMFITFAVFMVMSQIIWGFHPLIMFLALLFLFFAAGTGRVLWLNTKAALAQIPDDAVDARWLDEIFNSYAGQQWAFTDTTNPLVKAHEEINQNAKRSELWGLMQAARQAKGVRLEN